MIFCSGCAIDRAVYASLTGRQCGKSARLDTAVSRQVQRWRPFRSVRGAATIGPLAMRDASTPSSAPAAPAPRALPRSPSGSFATRSPSSRRASDHLRARAARPLRRLHRELVQFGVARPAARPVEPGAPLDEPRRVREAPSATRSTCSRTTRPSSRAGSRVRTPIASRASNFALGCGGRAADRRLRRMVRVPPPCAARAGDHVLFIGEVVTCERAARAAGLVFHHGRFGDARDRSPESVAVGSAAVAAATSACAPGTARASCRKTGPGLPPANGWPSTVVIASTSLVDDDSHISSAASASACGTGRISSGMPASRANSQRRVVGDAGQDQVVLRRRDDRAAVHDEHVRRRRLGQVAVAEHHGLDRARVGGELAHQHVAEQRDRLEVAALPAVVVGGDDGDAVLDLLARRRRQRVAHHEHGRRHALRKRVVALRHAARDLEVDALVVERLARDELADDRRPIARRCADSRGGCRRGCAAGARDAAAGGTACAL